MSKTNANMYPVTVPANSGVYLAVPGNMFKILTSSTNGKVKITGDFGILKNISIGQGVQNSAFNSLYIEDLSGSSNDLTLIVGSGDFIDSATSVVTVSVNKAPIAPLFAAQKTVTTTAAAVASGNNSRQYFLLQNKDATGNVWVAPGTTATQANGVKVPPGGMIEFTIGCSNAISAIGDIASNANIVTVEG